MSLQRKEFPLLYKKSSTGAIQHWKVIVHEGSLNNPSPNVAIIETVWGQADGAYQTTYDTIDKGKNIGRSNETTPFQQAVSEAQSHWEKKLKKGYVKTLKEAEQGNVDTIIEGGIFPMLALEFSKPLVEKKLKYPCACQPKFDGHRCIAEVDERGECTLWTRTRKPITSMNHICAAIEALGMHSIRFDGELYNHEYKDNFEDLTSFIRNSEAQPGAELVQYHIYDLPSSWGFKQRHDFLKEHLGPHISFQSPLRLVETRLAHNKSELLAHMEDFLEQGYEGAMARNLEGTYLENKRSPDLQKVKVFTDAEFEVVAVEEGRGKLKGHAIFVCKTAKGTLFRAKLKGEQEKLKEYFEHPERAIGRQLTVKYQGITRKSEVPRFPVALRFYTPM